MINYFEAFGECSKRVSDEVLVSGRYKEQEGCLPYIIEDITAKLGLTKKDILLDIGCGTGVISNILAKKVSKIVLNDHKDVLDFLKNKYKLQNMTLLPGDFTQIAIETRFDKILAYSVIHYLKSNEEIIKFIDKAVSILKPGGVLLIGDIPNLSKKERFLNTSFGKEFSSQFSKQRVEKESIHKEIFNKAEQVHNRISDEFLISIIKSQRDRGNEAYVLPQNPKCAFSYTREDLIIVKGKE